RAPRLLQGADGGDGTRGPRLQRDRSRELRGGHRRPSNQRGVRADGLRELPRLAALALAVTLPVAMRTAALIALVVALAAPIGCREANAPEPSYCRKIGTPDELPRLYEDHGLSLVVLGDTVWLCPCGKARRL